MILFVEQILTFYSEITSLNEGHGSRGIDLVADKVNDIFDVFEVKFNTAVQKMTDDGLQGCRKWVKNRLVDAVGRSKAKEIGNNFRVILSKVDESGKIKYYLLDDAGKKIGLATF